MSYIKTELPIVSLVKLQIFAKMDKLDQWFGLIPEIINLTLTIANSVKPYFNYTLNLWETSNIVAGNGQQYFAVHSLRSILERIALLWSTSSESV